MSQQLFITFSYLFMFSESISASKPSSLLSSSSSPRIFCLICLCSWLHFFFNFFMFISSCKCSGIFCNFLSGVIFAVDFIVSSSLSMFLRFMLSWYWWCFACFVLLNFSFRIKLTSSLNFSINSLTKSPPSSINSQSTRFLPLNINWAKLLPFVSCHREVSLRELFFWRGIDNKKIKI